MILDFIDNYYWLKVFEKYTFETKIKRFKIKVIKLAISIGLDEMLYP